MNRILVLSHDLDVVVRKTLEEVAADPEYQIIVAGPEEHRSQIAAPCQFEAIPPIKSKFSPKAIAAIRRLVKRLKPDAIFSISTSALSCGLFATLGTKVRNIGYRGTQAKVRRLDPTYYLGLLNPRVSHIACETEDIAAYLAPLIGAEKVSWQRKPFELAWVQDAIDHPQSVPGIPDGHLRLICIGITKGRPHKGLQHLLEAMDLLRDEPVHLTVIGDADPTPERPNVTMLPTRSDATHFLPTHDILVLPSTRDASPRVVREAQACSLPCIVSDIAGARDLIVPGATGLLAEPGSAQAIARAVRQLAADPAKRRAMGQAACAHIAANYRMAPYAAYYKRLFAP